VDEVHPLIRDHRSLERTYREIRAKGTTAGIRDGMLSFDAFNERVGIERRYADDERFKSGVR
jgi:hypothetical protein